MTSLPDPQPEEEFAAVRRRVDQLVGGHHRARRELELAITDLSAYRLWAEARAKDNPHSAVATTGYVEEITEMLTQLRSALDG